MSDQSYQGGDQRRRRRRSGGKSHSGSGGRPPRLQSTPRSGVPAQTGFQKFLSIISFGLLGKPKPKARASATAKRPDSIRESRPVGSSGTTSSRPPREPRPPRREAPQVSPADITTERLYVGNLNYDATESDLFELFNGAGSVRNAEVVINNRTQRSKGFAFVTMASVEEARRAVEVLNGKDFMGRPIQLSGAKPISANENRGSRESENSAEPAEAV